MDIVTWTGGFCRGLVNYNYKYDHTGAITSYTVTGKVELDVDNNCDGVRIIIHELLHSVGFQHIQQRPDRDRHVRVNWNNINSWQHEQFEKKEGTTLGLPYDCGSVMHYARDVFSSNGRDTMSPVNDNCYIPTSQEWSRVEPMMSDGDVEAIRMMYCPNGKVMFFIFCFIIQILFY